MHLTRAHPVANFAAYAFAPPILVAPLGALSVIIGYVSDVPVLLAYLISSLAPYLHPSSYAKNWDILAE
jgi:hypothetical protein